MKESPNWLETPNDLMANILQRLGTVEIFTSAVKVCTTWREICKDPAMWKVIFVKKSLDGRDKIYDFERLTKQAVDLSCGELIDICLVSFGNDDLLDYIVLRSNKLKRLGLLALLIWPFIKCDDDDALAIANNMHELRCLDLSESEITNNGLEAILNGCLHLQSLDVGKCHNLNLGGILGKQCMERIKDFKHDSTQN
ncbi:unnamed protein product [Lactuca virosa]|uniref:F-box domain-containing protein n=1 Tax=Lactuca virosa TaxID=75947 RepID=A0AAU9PE82_9ASTR|nr:unnamed protein product [Lactuca virosa]